MKLEYYFIWIIIVENEKREDDNFGDWNHALYTGITSL